MLNNKPFKLGEIIIIGLVICYGTLVFMDATAASSAMRGQGIGQSIEQSDEQGNEQSDPNSKVIAKPLLDESGELLEKPEYIPQDKQNEPRKVELNAGALNKNYELILPVKAVDSIANNGYGEVVYNQYGFKVSIKGIDWEQDPDNPNSESKIPSLIVYFTNNGDRQASLKIDNLYIDNYGFSSFQDTQTKSNKEQSSYKINKKIPVYLLLEEFKAVGIQEVKNIQFDMHILDKDGNSMIDILNTRVTLYNQYDTEVQQSLSKDNK